MHISGAVQPGNQVRRAKEGRLSLLELPAVGEEEKKAKAKDVKRKEAAVLAAEPDTKRGRDQPESS